MNMKTSRISSLPLILALLLPGLCPAQTAETNSSARLFAGALNRLVRIVEPTTNDTPRTFATTLKIVKADGLPKELVGQAFDLAYQAPDRLRLSVQYDGQRLIVCRDQQEVWVQEPAKKFALLGSPEAPLFSTAPERKDTAPLGPVKLPLPREQLLLLPFLTDVASLPDETVSGTGCHVIKATPKPEAITAFKLPRATLQLWVRDSDMLPLRVEWREDKGTDVLVELSNPEFSDPWPAERWKLHPGEGEKTETVARTHLTRFLSVAFSMLSDKIPTLGPETGERRVVAREGNGRLEMIDGTRVLILKGSPEEMGRQHGTLLKKQINGLVDHILYGVGVGSSFEKGRWFFGEVELAQNRLTPFMDERYLREMDAMAAAASLSREEVRLANFFPELFHCSGFALFGKATEGGQMYHGRILDYLRGLGLEQNAIVMIFQPDRGNAWVNVGYAGFIGSVTAMNEKHIAIGEMGGRGQGHWDGKPMAELLREVMEKANTLEEAVEIMRKGPRTCEYYYVISDAKSNRAVGIAATPDKFETIWPGQSHPLLPHPVPDAVLMSAGDRYEELARRVQASYGKIDAQGARDLMKRPVCMTSNIHCALFEPGTLDFWVANADSKNAAAHTRFTHYNLAALLQPEKAP
jgi:outer membrane lipoprotein-sorting protein